ncbi:ester cyclase [Acaryochloris marina NIES-2412]|uniref:ester cyclase n=1 Tax=Acaryochloris marina TaxID=155978 RepID=UPI00405A1CD2
MNQPNIAREVYDAFQRGEFDRWDAVIHPNVITNSSAKFNNIGLDALKQWADSFLTAFSAKIDLVDEILAVDSNNDGRAVATINLHWKHVGDFFGLTPTGRTGTSIENLIMTIKDGKVIRIEVADTSLDLVIYMHERGWVFPQNIRPIPIIEGVERTPDTPTVDFR